MRSSQLLVTMNQPTEVETEHGARLGDPFADQLRVLALCAHALDRLERSPVCVERRDALVAVPRRVMKQKKAALCLLFSHTLSWAEQSSELLWWHILPTPSRPERFARAEGVASLHHFSRLSITSITSNAGFAYIRIKHSQQRRDRLDKSASGRLQKR
jgi:hypothetical protein